MAVIIDGKETAKKIIEQVKEKVTEASLKFGRKPSLAVILAGNDPASQVYVRNKEKKAVEAGFNSLIYRLDENVCEEELLGLIDRLNTDETIDGILLQLPLPKQLKAQKFLDKIKPEKDVDGFHPINTGHILNNEKPYAISCTPKGILTLLDEYKIPLEGKNVVIIGRSNIVGKPVALLLLNRNATVTIAHSKTANLKEICLKADIIISATGRADMVTKDMVKEGATVIDVGIIRTKEGKLRGDVDFNCIKEVAGYITPVPGGVGPMTIASLIENTFELFLLHNKREN